jgi:cytochrome c oxidase subunit 3
MALEIGLSDKEVRGGGVGNPGNQGGDPRRPDHNGGFESESQQSAVKLKIGVWVTLLIVLMTFAGLIASYVVIATNAAAEWKPFDLPLPVWISTILIVLSSASFELFRKYLKGANYSSSRRWLLITSVIGGLFIGSQMLAWIRLAASGVYLQSNQYAGLFYILTVIHALHVLGGILGLGYLLQLSANTPRSENQKEIRVSRATSIGLYWHFVGGLWLVLFVLLGFWK